MRQKGTSVVKKASKATVGGHCTETAVPSSQKNIEHATKPSRNANRAFRSMLHKGLGVRRAVSRNVGQHPDGNESGFYSPVFGTQKK